MKAKLKNHKANNDGTVALYLDKGADEYALLGLRGKEIEITEAKSETPETVPDNLATILSDYENATVRLRRYLMNRVADKPDEEALTKEHAESTIFAGEGMEGD